MAARPSTLRMRWLNESDISRLPPPSIAIGPSWNRLALVAGPPSPEKPTVPLPATVVMVPVAASTRLIRLLTRSSFIDVVEAQRTDAVGRFRFTGLAVNTPLRMDVKNEDGLPSYSVSSNRRSFEPGEIRENEVVRARRRDSLTRARPPSRPLAEKVANAASKFGEDALWKAAEQARAEEEGELQNPLAPWPAQFTLPPFPLTNGGGGYRRSPARQRNPWVYPPPF